MDKTFHLIGEMMISYNNKYTRQQSPVVQKSVKARSVIRQT